MEVPIPPLLNYGLSGIMIAVILWFMWYRETKTIPALITASNEKSDHDRQEFVAQLKEERIHCHQDHEDIKQMVMNNHYAILDLMAGKKVVLEKK